MTRLSKQMSGSLVKQRGFVFRLMHSLLIVALVVGLVVLFKTGKFSVSGLSQVPGQVSHWVGGHINRPNQATYRPGYAQPNYTQRDYDPRAAIPPTTYYDYPNQQAPSPNPYWYDTNNNSDWGNDIYKPAPPVRKPTTVAKPKEDTRYTSLRYAVQVAAGYDSRQLYAWRDALIADGFHAYIISLNTPKGLLLKLRVGAYNKRDQAEAMRDRLVKRYPQQGLFTDSFVIEGD